MSPRKEEHLGTHKGLWGQPGYNGIFVRVITLDDGNVPIVIREQML